MIILAIRVKKNNIGNIESSLNTQNPTLEDTEDDLVKSTFYFTDIYDMQKITRFIKKCEAMIRGSEAYSSYIGNLRNDKQLHFCALKGNITDEDASIEFHHYPFTLYDIVYTVIMKHIMDNKPFTSFSIVNEVLKLHSLNMVGLVPLSVTEHQLVHDGVRSLSIKSVFGDVNKFVARYNQYMDDNIIEKYNTLIKIL